MLQSHGRPNLSKIADKSIRFKSHHNFGWKRLSGPIEHRSCFKSLFWAQCMIFLLEINNGLSKSGFPQVLSSDNDSFSRNKKNLCRSSHSKYLQFNQRTCNFIIQPRSCSKTCSVDPHWLNWRIIEDEASDCLFLQVFLFQIFRFQFFRCFSSLERLHRYSSSCYSHCIFYLIPCIIFFEFRIFFVFYSTKSCSWVPIRSRVRLLSANGFRG